MGIANFAAIRGYDRALDRSRRALGPQNEQRPRGQPSSRAERGRAWRLFLNGDGVSPPRGVGVGDLSRRTVARPPVFLRRRGTLGACELGGSTGSAWRSQRSCGSPSRWSSAVRHSDRSSRTLADWRSSSARSWSPDWTSYSSARRMKKCADWRQGGTDGYERLSAMAIPPARSCGPG